MEISEEELYEVQNAVAVNARLEGMRVGAQTERSRLIALFEQELEKYDPATKDFALVMRLILLASKVEVKDDSNRAE